MSDGVVEPRRRGVGRPRARIPRVCEICGNGFEAVPNEVNRGAARYCSVPCRDHARKLRIPARKPDVPRSTPPVRMVCQTCGDAFNVNPHRASEERQARFCSETCFRQAGSLGPRTLKVERDCAYCGKPFAYHASVNHRIHCSLTCRKAANAAKRRMQDVEEI